MNKNCTRCHQVKPEEAFQLYGTGRRRGTCGECALAARRAREAGRRLSETPDDRLTRWLWEEYRLTREQHAAMVNAQGNACAICGKSPEVGKRLVVDHCHATGVVRALLCHPCNLAVGVYENRHQALANYLSAYGVGNPLLRH